MPVRDECGQRPNRFVAQGPKQARPAADGLWARRRNSTRRHCEALWCFAKDGWLPFHRDRDGRKGLRCIGFRGHKDFSFARLLGLLFAKQKGNASRRAFVDSTVKWLLRDGSGSHQHGKEQREVFHQFGFQCSKVDFVKLP